MTATRRDILLRQMRELAAELGLAVEDEDGAGAVALKILRQRLRAVPYAAKSGRAWIACSGELYMVSVRSSSWDALLTAYLGHNVHTVLGNDLTREIAIAVLAEGEDFEVYLNNGRKPVCRAVGT